VLERFAVNRQRKDFAIRQRARHAGLAMAAQAIVIRGLVLKRGLMTARGIRGKHESGRSRQYQNQTHGNKGQPVLIRQASDHGMLL
jgi:hypothetical protein